MKRTVVTYLVIVFQVMLMSLSASTSADTISAVSLEAITVTAVKQGADLAGSAISGSQISMGEVERNRIQSIKNISDVMPNIFVPDYGSHMTSTIYVRGIGTRIDQPAIGLTIDNVPILCKENFDFNVFDIADAELLRGPQSTLFGRNTMGGMMSINTLSPMNYQGLRILAEYGSHNSIKAGASYYFKPSRSFGAMAGVQLSKTDGSFTNQFNGKKTDHEKHASGRLKAMWRVSDRVMLSNVLMLNVSREGGYPYENTETALIAYNDTCFYRRTNLIDGITVSADLGRANLWSTTSYQYINDNMTLDQDFTTLPYFTLTQARKEHAVTQDIVVKSKSPQRYSWLAGLFGFYRRYRMSAPVTFKDTGISELIESHRNEANPDYPITWDERSFLLGSDFTSPSWGVALYHESKLELTHWVLSAGLRVDYEHARLNFRSETHTGYTTWERATGEAYRHSLIDIDDSGSLDKDFVQVLPCFSAMYRPGSDSRWNIYGSIRKGSKSGGFNTQMFSDVLEQRLMNKMGIGSRYKVDEIVGYKPEKAWNYELGGHYRSLSGKFTADASVFYMDCRDRQLTIFPDGTTTGRVMTNAGKTRSIGAELSATLIPLDGMRLSASYGYCNAKFVDYNDGKQDHKGHYVPYSPSHTLWIEASKSFPINSAAVRAISISANLRGAGEIWWNEANTMRQPFYAQLGANATIEGKHYSLELWGQNITGTKFNTFYFVSIGHEFLQRGRGRMLGATLRLNLL
ncbi:MAG: TonB-dependent receptor [Muribaculaceae bacterium]|nr:TonB-dependent receptor [Muribaculaceae bacterium]